MKKILTGLLFSILLTLSGLAQTIVSGGHTYVAIPADTLEGAQATARTLGGHLITFDDESEYVVANQFVTRGTGWWWTGHSGGLLNPQDTRYSWLSDTGIYSLYANTSFISRHWNPNQFTTPTKDARIMLGCFQIIPRSTKWVMKAGNFTESFYRGQLFRAIVEIE